MPKFEDLKGKTLIEIIGAHKGSCEISFETEEGEKYRMYHDQDCCENVEIEDIAGDLDALIAHPILLAEESVSSQTEIAQTWVFYKLYTIKGGIFIRWIGEAANGYYSESVDFELVKGEIGDYAKQ